MKKFFTAFSVTTAVLFILISVVVHSETKQQISFENPTKYSSEYIISEHNGKLAVYKNNREIPVKIYNIYLENLPISDREELEKGITCKDDAEMRRLIEDYTS